MRPRYVSFWRKIVERAAVAHQQATMGLSERRAYRVVSAVRTKIRHRSRRSDDSALRSVAQPRRYAPALRLSTLFILLRREGVRSGINRIYRIYREKGLAVRERRA